MPLIAYWGLKTRTQWDEHILTAFSKPLRVFVFLLGIYIALIYLPLGSLVDLVVNHIFRSLLIIILAWGAHILAGPDSMLSQSMKDRFKTDSILIPSISKTIQFVVWALALVIIADEWGYDVDGFVAGLGLGGLAFALAAKDLVANIFGGVVIILEKPFALGDWVEAGNIQGVVESISFRSTRFRTFEMALVTIPNSNLTNEAIINWSSLGAGRARFNLSIDYAGPQEAIQACLHDIRNLLGSHPGIDPDRISVHLENIHVSGLDILIQYFCLDTQVSNYIAIREAINFSIMDILSNHHIAMAAPGRMVYSPGTSSNRA